MKIGIAGHIATDNIARFIDGDATGLPRGYYGAPLLDHGHHSIVAYTASSDMPPAICVSASGDRFNITYCASRSRAFRYSEGRWGRAAEAFQKERALLSQAMQDDAPDLVHAIWRYEFSPTTAEHMRNYCHADTAYGDMLQSVKEKLFQELGLVRS